MKLATLFAATCFAFLGASALAQNPDEKPTRTQVVAEVRKLSDAELRERLDKCMAQDGFREKIDYEPCLEEIVRRGGEDWTAFLKGKLDALLDRKFKKIEGIDIVFSGNLFSLELLTALRRLEKQPDPVQVVVDAPNPLVAKPLALPALKVEIKNLDIKKLAVGFTDGGDYRSGRQARWRVVILDEQQKALPVRGSFGWMGGGVYHDGELKHGENWETELDLQRFIEPPPPGRYTIQILYHDTVTIANEEDIAGLVVCWSKPFTLVVERITIRLTGARRLAADRLVRGLEGVKPVKVVAGTYGEWAHEFVDPESTPGRLLAMQLNAVPALIDALQDPATPILKRAWILSLLYSATGLHDPRGEGAVKVGKALGAHESREGNWAVWGGKGGEQKSGGFGISSTSIQAGEIDVDAQQALIDIWVKWLKTVNVVGPDA